MAESIVTTPSGQRVKVTHPEGATQQEIVAYAKLKAPIADRLTNSPALPPAQRPSAGESLLGAGEAVLSMGTSIPVEMLKGSLGGTEMWINALRGKGDHQATREKWEGLGHGYQPRTPEGQRMLSFGTYPFRAADEYTTKLANDVVDQGRYSREMPRATGAVGSAIKTTPDLLMTLAGLKGMRSPVTRRADVRGVQNRASDLNLDITQPTAVQAEQLATTAEGMTPGTGRYDGLDNLPDALRRQRRSESTRIGGIFDEAEGMGAQVPSRTAGGLSDNLQKAVSGFAYESMPAVTKLLEEARSFALPAQTSLSEVLGARNTATTPVNKIFEFRAKINDNLPSDYRSPEYAALSRMKKEVDTYLNDTLTQDLVTGNPQAVTKWQEAIKEWHDFRNTFDENAVVRKLQEQGATAEQVHSLIFGMGKLRAPRQAGNVVTNLEKILGRDSDEFKSIQSGLMTRLVEPLVDAEPNLKKFSAEYDAFKRNNGTLMDRLFDADQRAALDDMAEFARAIDKTRPLGEAQMGKIKLVWQNILARFGVGHGIAQGAARVSITTKLLEMMTPNMGQNRKRQIMSEMLGYDPTKSIFQNSNPVATTATYEALSEPRDELSRILRQ